MMLHQSCYLLKADDGAEEQKGFPPNREFLYSREEVLLSVVTGLYSGM